jgi:predicted cupin superfamily sugar epimerase
MQRNATYWIKTLGLTQHVEGGSFRETYRSSLMIPNIPGGQFTSPRSASTNIYFLLENGQFSALHRIKSDETWHFYDGDGLDIFEIERDGSLTTHKLGRNAGEGESFQVVIRAGNWFGSRVSGNGAFALAGCTVAPGFDFEDFELGKRSELVMLFPQHEQLINQITYG